MRALFRSVLSLMLSCSEFQREEGIRDALCLSNCVSRLRTQRDWDSQGEGYVGPLSSFSDLLIHVLRRCLNKISGGREERGHGETGKPMGRDAEGREVKSAFQNDLRVYI